MDQPNSSPPQTNDSPEMVTPPTVPEGFLGSVTKTPSPGVSLKKHLPWIPVLLIILFLVSTGIATYFFLQTQSLKSQLTQTITPVPTPQPSVVPVDTGMQQATANWQTYTNDNLQLSFKYPSEWQLVEKPDNILTAQTNYSGMLVLSTKPFELPNTKCYSLSPKQNYRLFKRYIINFFGGGDCYDDPQYTAVEMITFTRYNKRYFLYYSEPLQNYWDDQESKNWHELNGLINQNFERIISTFMFTDFDLTSPESNTLKTSVIKQLSSSSASWINNGEELDNVIIMQFEQNHSAGFAEITTTLGGESEILWYAINQPLGWLVVESSSYLPNCTVLTKLGFSNDFNCIE